MRNKGQVSQLPTIALGLVLAGVMLAVGSYILSTVQTSSSFDTEVLNFTRTFTANNTWYMLPYKAKTVYLVGNGTRFVHEASLEPGVNSVEANITWENIGSQSRIKLYSNETFVYGLAYNVTYEAYNSDSYMMAQNSSVGIGNLANWLPLIALVIAAGVIIMLLVGAFGR